MPLLLPRHSVVCVVLPRISTEREAVREAMQDTSEGETWIVKPASSACGRGIYITKNFADLPGKK